MGFGKAIGVAHTGVHDKSVRVAAVMGEDQTVLKDSIFHSDRCRGLLSIPEFKGKIAAVKACSSILVITQTES
jgi:hypothetical protein